MFRPALRMLRFPLASANRWSSSPVPGKSRLVVAAQEMCFEHLHTSSMVNKKIDNRKINMIDAAPPEEGTEGEHSVDIDATAFKTDIFPDENLPDRLFHGVPFKEIPIVNIRVSSNNTIITVTDHKGVLKILNSCGIEGFKHTKKGTNIAAQATAISLSAKALEDGFKMVRVRVRGMGPGRMSAIKGLQMGGLNIVSVTDSTRVTWNPLRAQKPRRL